MSNTDVKQKQDISLDIDIESQRLQSNIER